MPDPNRYGHVSLDVHAGRHSYEHAAPRDETPFCVAILADLSARTGREAAVPLPPLAQRRAMLVDRDDLDAVLARVAPTLSITVEDGAPAATVRFASLDDFHPARLYERLPLFAALRELRRRLADPGTFAAAAAELSGAAHTPRPTAPSRPASPAGGGGLLDQILADAPEAGPPPEEGGDLAAFIRQAVRPYLVPRPDPRQAEMLAAVDQAIAAQLRRVLHDPAVQALEATWRGLDLLVRRVETGTQLRLAVVDVTADELAADVAASAGGERGLARMLAASGDALPEPAPWSLLAVLHDASDDAADVALLDALATLGATLGAAVLAGAHPRLAMLAVDATDGASGDEPEAEAAVRAAWRRLRRSPAAPWLALLLPRVLLRLPYGGAEGEPCDVVRFEELEPADAGASTDDALAARHGRLLWGSPTLIGAIVLASAFAADGWRMRPRAHLDVDRLPLYLHHLSGDTVAQHCIEVALGVDDVDRLLGAGVLPLVTPRDSDTVRMAGLGSVAEGGEVVAGRWSRA